MKATSHFGSPNARVWTGLTASAIVIAILAAVSLTPWIRLDVPACIEPGALGLSRLTEPQDFPCSHADRALLYLALTGTDEPRALSLWGCHHVLEDTLVGTGADLMARADTLPATLCGRLILPVSPFSLLIAR